jgi:PAS domain S-box-containing protein
VIPHLIKRRRLEHGLGLSTALLIIAMISTTLVMVQSSVDRSLNHGLEARALSVARSIGAVARPSLLAYNYAALQIAAAGAVDDPDIQYVLIRDKEGSLAASAGAVGAIPEPLPEQILGHLTRELRQDDTRVLEASVPVQVEGVVEPWGTVTVALRGDLVAAELRRLTLSLALFGVLLALCGVLCARWMARRIAAPLRRLVQGTEALAWGNTSYRIPVSGARELAELAQAFNRMMDRVRDKADESQAYQAELANLNATLEEQVRQRTRALEESEAQYRTLVEHSPESILIVQDDRVCFVNKSFIETFGVDEEHALSEGFRLDSLFEPESKELVKTRIAAWIDGRSPGPAQVQARDADGNPHELELYGSRIEYLGRPAAECLMVDMTETKQLREKFEDTERLRALGELSSGVAHDFNNMLGAILGRIQLLRKRDFNEEVDEEMAVIEKAAKDGRETVRRIQEFSRTRADRPFTPVDMPELIRDAVEMTRTRWKTDAELRNITIKLSLDCEEVPTVMGNPTELREVVTNLILNACDAMPAGGELLIRCHAGTDTVFTEVEDTGIGMAEETRRRLFDPFFTTKGLAGTGMGMSVAYGIIKRHKGNIEVNSSFGRGTCFVLEFPAHSSPTFHVEEALPEPGPSQKAARILVIDDERPIAELLKDGLSLEGHAVEIADSGREGVQRASERTFDLVLTDLGMPDMSGWEVTSRIQRSSPGVPVVLVTGWGATITEEEVESAGLAGVVHKPFEIQELLATTARVLEQHTPES